MDIVKQPNDKYALFDRNNLDFVHVNLIVEDVLRHHPSSFLWETVDSGGFSAKMRVADQMGVKFWNACLLMIKIVHGRRRYQEIIDSLIESEE